MQVKPFLKKLVIELTGSKTDGDPTRNVASQRSCVRKIGGMPGLLDFDNVTIRVLPDAHGKQDGVCRHYFCNETLP